MRVSVRSLDVAVTIEAERRWIMVLIQLAKAQMEMASRKGYAVGRMKQ